MKLNILKTVAIFLFTAFHLNAQDPIFSQTFAAPNYFNPALSGAFDGSYQLSTLYREQWRGTEAPFTSYMLNIQGKFDVSYSKTYTPDVIGVGLIFMSDVVDHFGISTNEIRLVGSYNKSLNKNSNQYLSIGFSGGVIQKTINYDNLTFEDQFDQLNGYNLTTGEVLPPNNIGVGDLTLGINYAVSPNDRTRFYAGVAFHHVTNPNVSFFKRETNINPAINTDAFLGEKLVFYAGSKNYLNEEIYLTPRILVARQLDNLEITPGTNVGIPLSFASEIIFGAALRVLDHADAIGPSAVILMTAFQYKDFQFGLSYDANLQDIAKDRTGLDAFELSIRFNGSYSNDVDICPTF